MDEVVMDPADRAAELQAFREKVSERVKDNPYFQQLKPHSQKGWVDRVAGKLQEVSHYPQGPREQEVERYLADWVSRLPIRLAEQEDMARYLRMTDERRAAEAALKAAGPRSPVEHATRPQTSDRGV